MSAKALWILVLVAMIVVGAALIIGWMKGDNAFSAPTAGQGKVVIAITDAAADIQNVSEIKMAVSKIEMHSQTEGWVTVSNKSQEFNLLKLKAEGKWQLSAQENVKVGIYDQTRLMVSSVIVVKNDDTSETAKVPSGELKINSRVTVVEGQTSTVAIDIIGDASLHLTGNGKYIFAPVAHVVTRSNANATIASDNFVSISGGNTQTDISVGMDISGEVKTDFKIGSDEQLEIGL